jgi:hypothetical protein
MRIAAWGGFMPRSMMALLAAVAAGLPVLATFAHGDLVWVTAGDVAAAAGILAYVSAAPRSERSGIFKRNSSKSGSTRLSFFRKRSCDTPSQPEFVLFSTTPAEDHSSTLREALEAVGVHDLMTRRGAQG